MRLIVGTDEDGHNFAIRVDTFERLKMALIEVLINFDKDLALKMALATTEEELMTDEVMDAMIDSGSGYFNGRDYFTTLYDPMEKK